MGLIVVEQGEDVGVHISHRCHPVNWVDELLRCLNSHLLVHAWDVVGSVSRELHYRRPEDPHEAVVTYKEMDLVPSEAAFYNGYTFEEAFRTEVKVATQWYANQAQFRDRQKLARKEILHVLYRPYLQRAAELRARLYDRDHRRALEVLDEIEKELVE